MPIRTDLAMECVDFKSEKNLEGVTRRVDFLNGRQVFRVSVAEKNEIGKPKGEYITIDTDDFRSSAYDFEKEVSTIAALLCELIGDNSGRVLVAGLGNRDITPDALGPKAVASIFVSSHISQELRQKLNLTEIADVSAISPGVLGQTGVESGDIIRAVAETMKAKLLIVIDALAAKSVERLATTVQLSSGGIAPGSGVQNSRSELNSETMGIPVISIGVPMVVDMATIAEDLMDGQLTEKGKNTFVTPREVDLAVEHAAKTVAFAINKALNKTLSFEDLTALVGA